METDWERFAKWEEKEESKEEMFKDEPLQSESTASECGVCFDSCLRPKNLSVKLGADVPERSALNQSTWLLTLSEGQIPFTLTFSHPA